MREQIIREILSEAEEWVHGQFAISDKTTDNRKEAQARIELVDHLRETLIENA